MSDNGVTREGKDLIQDWHSAKKRAEQARSELNRAETDARNAENALAKWLLPSDSHAGEKIAVWFGDSLVEATAVEWVGSKWTGTVRWRTLGPKLHEFLR